MFFIRGYQRLCVWRKLLCGSQTLKSANAGHTFSQDAFLVRVFLEAKSLLLESSAVTPWDGQASLVARLKEPGGVMAASAFLVVLKNSVFA